MNEKENENEWKRTNWMRRKEEIVARRAERGAREMKRIIPGNFSENKTKALRI